MGRGKYNKNKATAKLFCLIFAAFFGFLFGGVAWYGVNQGHWLRLKDVIITPAFFGGITSNDFYEQLTSWEKEVFLFIDYDSLKYRIEIKWPIIVDEAKITKDKKLEIKFTKRTAVAFLMVENQYWCMDSEGFIWSPVLGEGKNYILPKLRGVSADIEVQKDIAVYSLQSRDRKQILLLLKVFYDDLFWRDKISEINWQGVLGLFSIQTVHGCTIKLVFDNKLLLRLDAVRDILGKNDELMVSEIDASLSNYVVVKPRQ